MQKIFLILIGAFILGCSSKTLIKKQPSVEIQKYNAQEEWKNLDKE